jgi:hypothetical protein
VKQGVAWASLAVPDGGGVLAAEWEEGGREVVLWMLKAWCEVRTRRLCRSFRCSWRSEASVSVLSGAMISMGRTLEKLGS